MKTTIYVLECSCIQHQHSKWHSLSAYDNLNDAVERMEYLKKIDDHNGDADTFLYCIREVPLYRTDD